MSAGLRAGKSPPVCAQDAFVRISAQERLHQRGEARSFRFFSAPPSAGHRIPSADRGVSGWTKKSVVAYHLKMLCLYVADIASDRIFLGLSLLAVLLRAVVVIVEYHGATAVVPELRRRHWRVLKVAAQIFDAPPGAVGFLRKVDLPATPVLRLQITLPLLSVADMSQPRQAAGVNQVVTEAGSVINDEGLKQVDRICLRLQCEPSVILITIGYVTVLLTMLGSKFISYQ